MSSHSGSPSLVPFRTFSTSHLTSCQIYHISIIMEHFQACQTSNLQLLLSSTRNLRPMVSPLSMSPPPHFVFCIINPKPVTHPIYLEIKSSHLAPRHFPFRHSISVLFISSNFHRPPLFLATVYQNPITRFRHTLSVAMFKTQSSLPGKAPLFSHICLPYTLRNNLSFSIQDTYLISPNKHTYIKSSGQRLIIQGLESISITRASSFNVEPRIIQQTETLKPRGRAEQTTTS